MRTLAAIFASFLLAATLAVGFAQPALAALPEQRWIQECERRNVLGGCNCRCRQKSDSLGNPTDSGEFRRCAAINADKLQFEMSACNEVYNPAAGGNRSTTSIFNLFPNLGNGLIALSGNQVNVGETMSRILFLLALLAVIMAVLLAFYGAYTIMSAGGDDEKAQNGRSVLRNALIGLFFALAAALIVVIASAFLGFTPANQDIDNLADPNTPTRTVDDDADVVRDILEGR